MSKHKILTQRLIAAGVAAILAFAGFKIYNKVQYDYYQELEPIDELQIDTWYKDNPVIIHAAGGLDGVSYTNSKESLLNSIKNNAKVIEIDFNYTSDGHLVCYHTRRDVFIDESKFTLEEFMNMKIQGKYTPMQLIDVISIMKENPELLISVDIKSNNLLTAIKDIVSKCNDKDILNRLIIQCFYPGEKEKVREIYPFPEENFLFAGYKYSRDPYRILEVCYNEGFRVVTVNKNSVNQDIIKLFKDKNIRMYVYTVNRIDEANALFENGVYGIYTDFLYDYDPREN